MSNQIQIFDFNSNQVRIQIINNKEYFCAKDVCDILGYSNGRDAIEKHCKPRGVAKRDTLTNGGMQQLSYIDEPNLYRLISHSKLPSAEKFEAWVFEEILPTIRKTGKFEIQQLTQREQVLLLAQNLLDAKKENQTLRIENSEQEKVITEFISIEGTKNYTEVAKILHIPPQKFISWLKTSGYICLNRLPKQEFINREYFRKKLVEKKTSRT